MKTFQPSWSSQVDGNSTQLMFKLEEVPKASTKNGLSWDDMVAQEPSDAYPEITSALESLEKTLKDYTPRRSKVLDRHEGQDQNTSWLNDWQDRNQ